MFTLIWLLTFSAGAADIPQQVLDRLSYVVRAEVESQMKAAGACNSEDGAFEAAERRLTLLEQSLSTNTANRADKFDKLIEFFRAKMIHKCCQLAGKSSRGGGGGGGGRGRKRGLGQ